MSFEPILLAPEEQVEEIYPYRRVWRTSWLEIWVLLLAVAAIWVLTHFFGALPATLRDPLPKLAIALLPLAAWLVFSFRAERRAPQPRPGLVGLLILGVLAANGVAIPLQEHLFTPDRWLPGQGFFGRVLGYGLTVGVTTEFLKYAILRYTGWPQRFRQRLDGVAYALTVSLGFAVVYNVHFALDPDMTLTATALRVASVTFSQLGIGVVTGYFLAELRIGRPPIFWLSAGLLLAGLLHGIYYSFRGIAIVSGLGVGATASSPERGLALAFGLVAALFAVFAFLIESSDARMEALTGRREVL